MFRVRNLERKKKPKNWLKIILLRFVYFGCRNSQFLSLSLFGCLCILIEANQGKLSNSICENSSLDKVNLIFRQIFHAYNFSLLTFLKSFCILYFKFTREHRKDTWRWCSRRPWCRKTQRTIKNIARNWWGDSLVFLNKLLKTILFLPPIN